MKQIKAFIDSDGRVKAFPAKQLKKSHIFYYISQKFERDKRYTESEVNDIINAWHTFGDYPLIRRGMVDLGYLLRERDCSQYWLNADATPPDGYSD